MKTAVVIPSMRGPKCLESFLEIAPQDVDFIIISEKKLIGKNAVDLSPEYQIDTVSSKEKALQLLSKVLQNEPQEFEWEHLNGKGESFTVSISLNKISLSGINYLQAIVRDITEKKQKEIG